MSNLKTSAAMGASALAMALIVTSAAGAMPVIAVLVVAAAVSAAFAAVAFAAQSGRFDDARRPVYQPVYVRSRNVHRRVRSIED